MAEGSPINEIMEMKKQGLSNNQIIQNLQREGYSNTQVFDAMNQADTKMAVEGMQPARQQSQQPQPSQPQEMFTQPPAGSTPPMASSDMMSSSPEPSFEDTQVKVEELVEAVIEEKWDELVKDVNKIVDWKNKVESRVSEIEVTLNHLKESYSELQKAIMGKVTEYDRHIQEVGSEIKAMEKVFSKVLPKFTENINDLSKIAEKLKKTKDKK